MAVLYEFQQRGSPVRTFDPLDIVASVVGGVLGYLLLRTYARDEDGSAAATEDTCPEPDVCP